MNAGSNHQLFDIQTLGEMIITMNHEIKACLHCDCPIRYDNNKQQWDHSDSRHSEYCECCNPDY